MLAEAVVSVVFARLAQSAQVFFIDRQNIESKDPSGLSSDGSKVAMFSQLAKLLLTLPVEMRVLVPILGDARKHFTNQNTLWDQSYAL